MPSVSSYQFQAVQGPADGDRRHTLTEGYQPVSRIGEVVINSFVDAYEFAALDAHLKAGEMTGEAKTTGEGGNEKRWEDTAEYKPMFHEWATALPGMICVSRKARNATFRNYRGFTQWPNGPASPCPSSQRCRIQGAAAALGTQGSGPSRNYVAAETATPVITSCACLKKSDETQFYFAGICRSKSVRPIDDGVGPSVDEFFTLAIGGMATLLNNSKSAIFPGDYIEWTFFSEMNIAEAEASSRSGLKRNKKGPRRIGVRVASSTSSRVIGKALSFAKSSETFDLLIKAA